MPISKRRLAFTWIGLLAIIAALVFGWRLNAMGVRTASPFASVALAFDPPPGSPGYAWTRDGRPVRPGELATFAGPDHCGWQSATFLLIGWPLGTAAATASEARLYIRDPQGAMSGAVNYRDLLDLSARVPSDARSTGYRFGHLELFLSPSDQDEAIYVVARGSAERWARSDPISQFCL